MSSFIFPHGTSTNLSQFCSLLASLTLPYAFINKSVALNSFNYFNLLVLSYGVQLCSTISNFIFSSAGLLSRLIISFFRLVSLHYFVVTFSSSRRQCFIVLHAFFGWLILKHIHYYHKWPIQYLFC